jgi:hypothetical protein
MKSKVNKIIVINLLDSYNEFRDFDEFSQDYNQSSLNNRNYSSASASASASATAFASTSVVPSFSSNISSFNLSQQQQNNYSSSTLNKAKELSNTLIISDLGPDINLSILEDIFREKCLDLQTSMPEDIRFLESIRSAYIIFPSIPAATIIFESTLGKILINGNYYNLDFTPNFSNNNNPYIPSQNRPSLTYVTSVNDNSSFTTSMETTVHEDWICEFVKINQY